MCGLWIQWIMGTLDHVDCVDYGIIWIPWIMDTVDYGYNGLWIQWIMGTLDPGLARGVITSGKNRGNYLGEKRGKRFLVFTRGKTKRRGKNLILRIYQFNQYLFCFSVYYT